jgi:hypothetical protein
VDLLGYAVNFFLNDDSDSEDELRRLWELERAVEL